ncbi:MAG: glycosyltransferase family 2 protein [Candidatus Lernaella stagnicola]|nr:glycosyltransferase family 2 protein [Candidatus Lernaella stagnicola]
MESLSVIIPAFNESQTIAAVAAGVRDALEGKIEYEVLIVDDGSTDETAAVAETLTDRNVRLLRHDDNRGSGRAIRTGLEHAAKDLATYVPADGQFNPDELPEFVHAAANADIVIGFRTHREGYGVVRKMQSAVYVWLVNLVFRQRFRDVNWVHMWRMNTVGRLPVQSEGVFMQQELLVRARRRGLRIVEVPSQFHRRTGGLANGSRPTVILKTIADLLRFVRAGAGRAS